MMTYSRMTISLLVLVVLASCVSPASDLCAGWRPVLVANATVDYLAANDGPALAALIEHQEFGRSQGCWR